MGLVGQDSFLRLCLNTRIGEVQDSRRLQKHMGLQSQALGDPPLLNSQASMGPTTVSPAVNVLTEVFSKHNVLVRPLNPKYQYSV